MDTRDAVLRGDRKCHSWALPLFIVNEDVLRAATVHVHAPSLSFSVSLCLVLGSQTEFGALVVVAGTALVTVDRSLMKA